MDLPTIAIMTRSTPRCDGWTPERRAAFLECLCETPDITRACALVGLSRQAAYKLRRRDAVFALAWDVALEVAYEGRVIRAIESMPEKAVRTLSTVSRSSTSRH
jgi:hypothetical protein